MNARTLEVMRRGTESALLAGIPQVLLPKLQERFILEAGEDADVGPRLIEAIAEKIKQPLPEDQKWLGAASFHVAYAAFWGTVYGLTYERRPVRPIVGGLALGAFIHLVTFPRWGLAVLTGTENKPRERSWRIELVLATAPLVFGLGTALLYGSGPRRTLRERTTYAWRKRT